MPKADGSVVPDTVIVELPLGPIFVVGLADMFVVVLFVNVIEYVTA